MLLNPVVNWQCTFQVPTPFIKVGKKKFNENPPDWPPCPRWIVASSTARTGYHCSQRVICSGLRCFEFLFWCLSCEGRYLELWFRQVPWMDDADTSTGWFPPLARDAALQDAMSFAEDANGISPSMNDEQAACGCVGSSSGWLTRRHGKGKQKGVEEMSAMCRLLIHSFSCHGSFLNNWTWSWGIVNHSKWSKNWQKLYICQRATHFFTLIFILHLIVGSLLALIGI